DLPTIDRGSMERASTIGSAATVADLALAPPLAKRRRAIWTVAATALVLGGGLVTLELVRGDASAPVTPQPAALSPPGAVLARPLCEPVGADAASRGRGGAAGARACRRATGMLGGLPSHPRPPAELLDMPVQPADDFPRDPFADPGTVERSHGAARQRADA